MNERKAGRPPFEEGKRMRQTMITVDEETVEILREFGHGNLSQGVRAAAKEIAKNYTMLMAKDDS